MTTKAICRAVVPNRGENSRQMAMIIGKIMMIMIWWWSIIRQPAHLPPWCQGLPQGLPIRPEQIQVIISAKIWMTSIPREDQRLSRCHWPPNLTVFQIQTEKNKREYNRNFQCILLFFSWMVIFCIIYTLWTIDLISLWIFYFIKSLLNAQKVRPILWFKR